MSFLSDRRWLNPSQPKWLQWATWLVYWGALWGLVRAVDTESLSSAGSTRVNLARVLTFALVPLGVLGGSEMAMGRRRGYVMCLVAAFLPAVTRFVVGLGVVTFPQLIRLTLLPLHSGARLSSFLDYAVELFLIYCLLHTTSRHYAKVWLD